MYTITMWIQNTKEQSTVASPPNCTFGKNFHENPCTKGIYFLSL